MLDVMTKFIDDYYENYAFSVIFAKYFDNLRSTIICLQTSE